MPSYKETLEATMIAYPRLFLTEADYLCQAFFTIGNGLRWIDGELSDGRPLEVMIEEARKNREYTNKIYSDTFESLREDGEEIPEIEVYETGNVEIDQAKELKSREAFIEEGFDDGWYKNEDGTLGRPIYPISQFSKIMNLPDDIKPDWLEAAEKTVALCYTPVFKLTENDWKCIKEVVEPRIKELKNAQKR